MCVAVPDIHNYGALGRSGSGFGFKHSTVRYQRCSWSVSFTIGHDPFMRMVCMSSHRDVGARPRTDYRTHGYTGSS
jgi:hypothetical protein